MATFSFDPDKIQIRLAETAEEVKASQALRYKVFYEEFKATPTEEMAREKRDINEFDPITDHLIVLDTALPEGPDQIIGTYRLLRQEVAEKYGKFYTSDEYDISSLLKSKPSGLLELGRSCVLEPYRTRPILQKLWEGIAHYVADNNIELMFGCASIPGTDVEANSKILAYLYHYHLAPPEMCPKTLPQYHTEMNLHAKEDIDVKRTFISMPPLLKGYLRLGAYIGNGAYVDKQWNSIDVCIVLPSEKVREKYVKHYERKTNKSIPAGEKLGEKLDAKQTEQSS